MKALSYPTPALLTDASPPPLELANLLAPMFDAAAESSSLIASRHTIQLAGHSYDLPKFLLLGQRGGGQPIRLALFAGLDAGSFETTVALTRLLLQFELNPALARDYALFGYPVVNLRGFDTPAEPLRAFEARYARDTSDADVQFFKSQLADWSFDGLLSLRVAPKATGFSATVRSEVLAREVVQPSLEAIAGKLPLDARPVRLRTSDRYARLADHAHGKLSAPPSAAPHPFEIEIFAPDSLPIEQRVTGLFLTVHEILRNYRRLIAHGQNI